MESTGLCVLGTNTHVDYGSNY